jgi:hypothetical protein
MARNKNNIILNGFSGKIGNQLVVRTRGDKTFLAAMPRPRAGGADPPSHQLELQERFIRASKYAKAALAKAELREAYTAARKGNQTAFNVAWKDAFEGPHLSDFRSNEYHGKPGQQLSVQALDNFRVVKVVFNLFTEDGNLIESGEARVADNSFQWIYTTLVENGSIKGTRVQVLAEDLPGNQSALEVKL